MTHPSIVLASDVTPAEIASWLDRGAAVVLPTETVYGLAVKPQAPSGMRRVFELKGRPRDLNLPVLVGTLDQVHNLGVDFNDTAQRLAAKFWPGPLTLVVGFGSDRSRPAWLVGRVEVALRMSALKLLHEVAMIAGPILLTSANRHGVGPKHVAQEAADSLHGKADFVVDGGTLLPLPSTIINTRHSPARIERTGTVGVADLAEFIRDHRVVSEQE